MIKMTMYDAYPGLGGWNGSECHLEWRPLGGTFCRRLEIKEDDSVVHRVTLREDGSLYSLPVILDVDENIEKHLKWLMTGEDTE